MKTYHNFKFRAWHKKQKRMIDVYGLGPDFLTENTFDGVDEGTNAWHGEDMKLLHVMERTPYKDKSNAHIFEGDICKDKFGRIMSVVRRNGRLQWQCDDPGNNFKYADMFQWLNKGKGFAKNTAVLTVDIIGNIYFINL